MADDVTAPAGWLGSLSPDDGLAYARKLAAAMQQRMRGQSLSAAAPDGPVPDDAAASFDSRFGNFNTFGSLSPNVPLPQPRPASAPDGSALDNLYLSAPNQQQQPVQAAPAVTAPVSSPSVGDRAIAALANFGAGGHAGGLFGALTGAAQGAATGQRFDPIATQNQTVQALLQRPGMTPELARVLATNPQLAVQWLSPKQQQFTQIGEDAYGNKKYGFVDPVIKKVYGLDGNPVSLNNSGNVMGGNTTPPTDANGNPITGQAYLDSLKGTDYENKAGTIKAIVEGREPMPTGMFLKTPPGQWLQNALTNYEPGFDSTRWNMRNTFAHGMGSTAPNTYGGQVQSAGTILTHAANAYDVLPQFSQGILGTSNVLPSTNSYKSWLRDQIGDEKYQHALGQYEISRKGAADELEKMLAGSGGAEASKQYWLDRLDPNNAPAKLQGAWSEVTNLMMGKLRNVAAEKDRAYGGVSNYVNTDPASLLSGEQQAALRRIKGAPPAPTGPMAAPGAAPPAAAPPITNGTTAVNPQTGQRIRYFNGQWLPIGKVAQ